MDIWIIWWAFAGAVALGLAVGLVLAGLLSVLWEALGYPEDAPPPPHEGDGFDVSMGRWGYLHDRREG